MYGLFSVFINIKDVLINPNGQEFNSPVLVGNETSKSNTPVLSEIDPDTGFRFGQVEAIKKALRTQKLQLESTRLSLTEWKPDDQAKFKKYFGNVSDLETARQEKIKQIDHMLSLNEKMSISPLQHFIPPKNPPEPLPGIFDPNGKQIYTDDLHIGAYLIDDTDPSITTDKIQMGEGFFIDVDTLLPRTAEEQARILTHEMSHMNDGANTVDKFDGKYYNQDVATGRQLPMFNDNRPHFKMYENGNFIYGDSDSKRLADDISMQDAALYHADSFSYYVSETGEAYK